MTLSEGTSRAGRQTDETEIVVRADFDALDPDNCCWVSMRFLRGPRRPVPGELIELRDEHRGTCMAAVEEVHGWTARVTPDWNTFSGDTVPRIARESFRRLRSS
jgi:hypothetical protein